MGHKCLTKDNLKRQCGAIFFTKKTTKVYRFWNNKSGHLLMSNYKIYIFLFVCFQTHIQTLVRAYVCEIPYTSKLSIVPRIIFCK